MPQKILQNFLAAIQADDEVEASNRPSDLNDKCDVHSIGIGLDAALIPLSRRNDLYLAQTVDFFYPLIEDPVLMGKIAFANVTSDLYAMGCSQIDAVTFLCSVSDSFASDTEAEKITLMIAKGFQEAADSIRCTVHLNLNKIIPNEWIIIGGVATSVCLLKELCVPNRIEPGNCVVLTKPLGTQLATNAYLWMVDNHKNYLRLSGKDGLDEGVVDQTTVVTDDEITATYQRALRSMITLNCDAAKLMVKYGALGATDITGFGLMGHANNLLQHQLNNELTIRIHTIPLFCNIIKMSKRIGQYEKLRNGNGVETSGGLLVALPNQTTAKLFCEELSTTSWIIGEVGVKQNVSDEAVRIDHASLTLIED